MRFHLIATLLLMPLVSDVVGQVSSDQTSSSRPTDAASILGPSADTNQVIAEYFHKETSKLEHATFAEIQTLDDWTSRRPEYRRQMLEMLGLDPMPESTPLNPVITGTENADGVIVERLHFQSMPGLYVTANFYRPAVQANPLPAILYVCGHGGERADGRSLGNKTHYQHHGSWFAKNGYVCLIIDTVQLGEIEGIHHGTYREKMWWWNNRGYSSAGVEAYNCIRSLDYLQSREQVDGTRIGVTGRSGGGAYSWWIAAIDERITAAVPVAGITSLRNHVVDGCVEGHCDCMYMVNTYRWDFPMVAALVAPRPLLITNSDKDNIFPLDGVVDVYTKVRKIYALYGAGENLGLQISEGPHKDTQELQIAAMRWMNRFLRRTDELVENAAKPLFDKRDLRVFDSLPVDQVVTTIHEQFVPAVPDGQVDSNTLANQLAQKCFRGWPDVPDPADVAEIAVSANRPHTRIIEYTTQPPFRLKMIVSQQDKSPTADWSVVVLDQQSWQKYCDDFASIFSGPADNPKAKTNPTGDNALPMSPRHRNVVYLAPRGIGPTRWDENERTQTHIRRRFMLLGQTLAGMQIYDIVRGIETAQQTLAIAPEKLTIHGDGDAAFWSLYASLFVDGIAAMELTDLPQTNRDAPDLLNISRVATLKDVQRAATNRLRSPSESAANQ